MITIEDVLIDQLTGDNEVDGHDAGSGEANIFIRTNSPEQDFLAVQEILFSAGLMAPARAAFREIGKDDYKAIWPIGAQGIFGFLDLLFHRVPITVCTQRRERSTKIPLKERISGAALWEVVGRSRSSRPRPAWQYRSCAANTASARPASTSGGPRRTRSRRRAREKARPVTCPLFS